MKTIFVILLTTALLATITRADVFIYRGVDQIAADAQTHAPIDGPTLNFYLVVDYDAGQTGSILYGRIEGGKRFQVSNASLSSFTTAPLPNGKVASLIANGASSNTSPSDFNYNLTLYRGTNISLLIRKTPNHTTALRPNILKGSALSVTSTPNFVDLHSGLTLQGAATIKANDANQTIAQALATLVTGLTAKGFISF